MLSRQVSFNGITYDGFFVIVLDLKREKTFRFIDQARAVSFFRHYDLFKDVKEATYEYRFYKIQPIGVQLISKFRSYYGGIVFNY